MSCIAGCGRVLIVIINIFFILIGLVFFILGFLCKFGDSELKKYYQPILDNLSSSLSDSGFGTVDLSSFNIADLLGSLGVAFILIGLFLLIITVVGFLGACCKQKILLILYCILVAIVLIGQLTVSIILFTNQAMFTDKIKPGLKTSIQTDYQGLNGTNIVSLGWNFVQIQMKCCGVDTYQDFTGAPNWVIDYSAAGHTLQTPLSCCKTLPSGTDFTCASSPSTSNNYLNTGCFDTIWNLVFGNTALIAGILGGLGALQLMLIIFAVCVFLDARKANKIKDKS